MTSPLSPEAVAQMVDVLNEQGPHHRRAADMLTTLAAENATLRAERAMLKFDIDKMLTQIEEHNAAWDELRASEAAAMEALAEIGAVVTAIEGADSLDKEIIRNIRTRIAALTPTADKEPKT